MNYPRPPSHRTFTFGSVIIDSDFDSGNCSHASKNSLTNVTSSSHSMIFGSEQIILKTIIEAGSISQLKDSPRARPSLSTLKICKIKYSLII